MVVTPTLKVCVPTSLSPVSGEAPVVAPLKVHVRVTKPQLSLDVGLEVFTLRVQPPPVAGKLWLDGQLMVGGVVSTLFTSKVQDVLLPAASVAVMVTTVVPTPVTVEPGAGDCVRVIPAGPQLSVTVARER